MEEGFEANETASKPHRHRRTFLAHGDVPLVLLSLLSEHSMHGYEMIKSLEERSGGLYKPSAGAIYPTLSMLEDQELIESVQQGRKRVFSITVDGRDYLAAHETRNSWRTLLANTAADAEETDTSASIAELRQSVKDLLDLLFAACTAVSDSPEGIDRLGQIVARTHDDLEALVADK